MLVGAGQAEHQLGQRLGQPVGVGRALDVDHLGDAVELGGRLGHRGAVLAGDQQVDVAAHAPWRR